MVRAPPLFILLMNLSHSMLRTGGVTGSINLLHGRRMDMHVFIRLHHQIYNQGDPVHFQNPGYRPYHHMEHDDILLLIQNHPHLLVFGRRRKLPTRIIPGHTQHSRQIYSTRLYSEF